MKMCYIQNYIKHTKIIDIYSDIDRIKCLQIYYTKHTKNTQITH